MKADEHIENGRKLEDGNGNSYRHPFWANIFEWFSSSGKDDEYEILSEIPVFQNLRKRELSVVSTYLHEREYEPGEYIFRTHQPGAAMFIVEEGVVEVVHDKDGEDFILARLEQGEFFGELALLDNSPRSASAIAKEKARLLAIFRNDLEKLMISQPVIGAKILKQLAVIIGMRLKATNEQLSQNQLA